jgi:hypothetical protein
MDFSPTAERLDMALSEFNDSVYDWDPQVDEQDFIITETEVL